MYHVLILYLRQIAVGNDLAAFQSGGLGPGRGTDPSGDNKLPQGGPKQKKVVPLSKQISNKISSSSSKLAELMAWESKVTDNTTLFPGIVLKLALILFW